METTTIDSTLWTEAEFTKKVRSFEHRYWIVTNTVFHIGPMYIVYIIKGLWLGKSWETLNGNLKESWTYYAGKTFSASFGSNTGAQHAAYADYLRFTEQQRARLAKSTNPT